MGQLRAVCRVSLACARDRTMAAPSLTVRQLVAEKGAALQLTIVAGEEVAGPRSLPSLDRPITDPGINRPSLALAGFTDFFAYERIQVIGRTEIEYLLRLDDATRASRLSAMFGFAMPCVIVPNGGPVLDDMANASNEQGVPLMVTQLNTNDFCKILAPYLEMTFAPRIQLHAGLVEIFGMGVLLMGRSGVGKSECALELVERGHRLIADDVVIVRRLPLDRLVGTSNAVIRHHLELRGLGIIDVQSLFGVASVRDLADIDIVIHLEKWDRSKEYDRLGFDTNTTKLLGVDLPEYTLPIQPGRNTSILVEVATLHQRLKNTGRNPAESFEKDLLAHIERRKMGGPSS